MRNILVLPDGTEQDFMYPSDEDHEVVVGTKLEIAMMDDSVRRLKVMSVVKEEKRILYNTSYA